MKFNYLLIFTLFSSITFSAQNLDRDQIYLADPTIFEEGGTYYLYGTKADPNIKGQGFLVYSSQDLKTWKGPVGASEGFALKKGDSFGDKGFWAPQIFKYNAKYYMAYTANEQIAIASGESPLGPFTNNGNALESSVKQIDPFIFFDKDKVYLYHVRLQDGNRIFVAEINKSLTGIKPETLKECIHAEEKWENTESAGWPVTEGPTVFKNDGLYYLLYSANDFRNPDYAVGYATSENPLGPWHKACENPIISQKNTGYPGIGHGDLFYDGNDEINYVLHAHYSENKVYPRRTANIKLRLDNKNIVSILSKFNWLGK